MMKSGITLPKLNAFHFGLENLKNLMAQVLIFQVCTINWEYI